MEVNLAANLAARTEVNLAARTEVNLAANLAARMVARMEKKMAEGTVGCNLTLLTMTMTLMIYHIAKTLNMMLARMVALQANLVARGLGQVQLVPRKLLLARKGTAMTLMKMTAMMAMMNLMARVRESLDQSLAPLESLDQNRVLQESLDQNLVQSLGPPESQEQRKMVHDCKCDVVQMIT
jgi:hypothetical protein